MKKFTQEDIDMGVKLTECDELQAAFAGFDLGAWRQPNGTYKDHGEKTSFNVFPSEIRIFGNTYTLEELVEGRNDPEKGQWVNAIYV